MGNEVNWQKTRVVRSGKKQEVCDVVVRDQNVKQVAMMKYPLVQWLVVYENMDNKVQQIIEMESKIIRAIGSTYSVGKEGINQGYQTESVHC